MDPDSSCLVKEVYNRDMISGRFKVQSEPSKGQSTWPSYTPSQDFALAVMGIALPNNSSLARVVRASFAVDRFRRRFCHCYSAPFRLDTLNKFSVVRSSIKPREKKAMRSNLRTALSDSGPPKLRIQADRFERR